MLHRSTQQGATFLCCTVTTTMSHHVASLAQALLALACLAPPEGTEREDRLDPRALLGAPGRWESQAPRARRVKREMRVHVACRASRVQ